MVTKIIGYIVSLIGILGLALTVPKFSEALKITPPASLSGMTLTITSIVIIIIGIFLIKMGSGHGNAKGKEVPIYKGKQVVGYRRHK